MEAIWMRVYFLQVCSIDGKFLVIIEYSLIVGIGAAILAICYSASYAVHFTVFKSFREYRYVPQ